MKEALRIGVSMAALGIASSVGLAACVVKTGPPVASGVAVSGPPPEPVAEYRSPPPSPRAVWVAGYWHWTGMQYAWIPGHWEEGRPGIQWRGPRYPLRDGTYFYEPGRWSLPGH